MKTNLDRRSFLKMVTLSGATAFAFVASKSSWLALAETCDKVPAGHPAKMMTGALKYVPKSPKKGENCASCVQFASDSKDKKIGKCPLLQNCEVQAAGWCASWSKRS